MLSRTKQYNYTKQCVIYNTTEELCVMLNAVIIHYYTLLKWKRENFCAGWLTFSYHMSSYYHECTKLSTYFSNTTKSTRRLDRSVKDAYCSMAPDPTSNFCKGPSLLCSVFYTFGLNLKHCSLSPNCIHKFIKTEFVNVITVLSVNMLRFQKIY